MRAFSEIIEIGTITMENPFSSDKAARSIWQDFIEIADTYNEPGRFTAMTGYEWTSTPKGDNLHRCVILADGADKTSLTLPFGSFDSQDPEDLWKYLELYEEKTGGRAMAIPHNGNLSNGLMFLPKTFKGEDFTREYAEKRIKWEPLYEMTQIKGDEEAHPFLSADDEFAADTVEHFAQEILLRSETATFLRWVQRLPDQVRDVSYEAITRDAEGEMRKCLAFVGLDWTPDILDHPSATRQVSTASVAQVREPISPEFIGQQLNMPVERVNVILDELEKKLILWSIILGVVLLVLLTWVSSVAFES